MKNEGFENRVGTQQVIRSHLMSKKKFVTCLI